MALREKPFVGSEALANGLLRKHELRSRFQAVFPDVYLAKDVPLTLDQRAIAAWLWSHRHGVIAGLTASAIHGSKWVDNSGPVELIWQNARRPPGLRTYNMRLGPGEYGVFRAVLVTTPERTAFDIGRRGRLADAVARLDALGNATGVKAEDVLRVANDHPGVRGVRQLRKALGLSDGGAASPKETWLRLLLINAGFPRPCTQIPVLSADGRRQYYLDMGWEEIKLAVEYDGDQHRSDRAQFAYDIERLEDLDELGWVVVRVSGQHHPADIIRRVQRAWDSRTL
jgi:hypothetical protein